VPSPREKPRRLRRKRTTNEAMKLVLFLTGVVFLLGKNKIVDILYFFPFFHNERSLPIQIFPVYAEGAKKCAGFSLTGALFFGTMFWHTHP
jgi:hypothetical protein